MRCAIAALGDERWPQPFTYSGKKMMKTRNLLVALALLLSGANAPGQGLYIESKGSNSDAIGRFWHVPHMFRALQENGKISIVRIDKELMYQVDPEKKTYTEIPFAELKTMKGKASAMLKKRMESMTPEQKKMFEGMKMQLESQAGRSDETKYEIQKTNETKSISGYTCTKYLVRRNGKESETIWATNEVGGFEPVRKDMELLMSKISTNLGTGSVGSEWYKEIPGVPIQMESHGNIHTVTKIVQQSINPAEFEVPAGYTKTKLKSLDDSRE